MDDRLEWSATARPPSVIGLEVSTICNLRCVMCSLTRAKGRVNRPRYPDDALIQRLLPYMRQAQVIRLVGLGEPLLSPAFWTILRELNNGEHPKHIEVYTNGHLLDDQRIDRILNSPLSHISFSMDAARPETYRRLRNADLHALLAKIAVLIAERNRRHKTLHVQLNATIMRENIEELPELVEMVHTLNADSVRYWELSGNDSDTGAKTGRGDWQFSFADQALSAVPAIRERFVSETEAKAREYGIPIVGGGFSVIGLEHWYQQHRTCVPSTCYFPMVWLDVLSNGQARFCCYAGAMLGNIAKLPVEEVWNGTKAQETRTLLSEDRIPSLCSGAACSYIRGHDADGGVGRGETS